MPSAADPRLFKKVRHLYLILEGDVQDFVDGERKRLGLTARAYVTGLIRAAMMKRRMGQ